MMDTAASAQAERAAPLIIVIDDDAMTQRLMHDLLPEAGYRVATWGGATGAAELVARERPALVILDVRMEYERAGIDVLRSLRRNPATEAIPVLVASACMTYLESDERDEIAALRGETMSKPFWLDEFLGRVRELVAA